MILLSLRLTGIENALRSLAEIEQELRDLRPLWPRVQKYAAQDILANISEPGIARLTARWVRRKKSDRLFEYTGTFMKRARSPKISRTKNRFRASVGSEHYPYILHHGSKKTRLPKRPWFFWRPETVEAIEREAQAWIDEVIARACGKAVA